jgi:hypothetical protein
VCSFVVFAQAALGQTGAAPQPVKEAAERAALEAPVQAPLAQPALDARQPTRPALLAPMYGTYIALQGLDIHSTLTTVGSGHAREGNPLLPDAAHNPAGLIAIKAASTAGVIWGTEKLWKRNRVAAVVLMVGVNSAMAAIVAHNYRHAR